jgi:nicotinate-nucleotide adenylyltransferase
MPHSMSLGILGGTFDPPHVGHLILAEEARLQAGLSRVLWVPAGVPWRKAARVVSPVDDRVEMVRRAIAGNGRFELCTLEAERPGPSYMVETLVALKERHPGSSLALIVGSDALQDLPSWNEAQRLLSVARLLVARRSDDGEELVSGVERALPGVAERVVWIDMPRIDISSTELRRRVADGQGVRYLVPDAVAAYIEERRLYRGA